MNELTRLRREVRVVERQADKALREAQGESKLLWVRNAAWRRYLDALERMAALNVRVFNAS